MVSSKLRVRWSEGFPPGDAEFFETATGTVVDVVDSAAVFVTMIVVELESPFWVQLEIETTSARPAIDRIMTVERVPLGFRLTPTTV